MARLTTFSKFLITLLIVAIIGFGLIMARNSGILDKIAPPEKQQEDVSGMMKEDPKPKKNKGLLNNKSDSDTKTSVPATSNNSNSNSSSKGNGKGSNFDGTFKVGVVTWGGYAGGQYFNEGFKANTNSRFYKDYGFKVDFKVLDDFDASRAAWKAGDVDLLWATIDAFPTEVEGLQRYEPQVVFQADWSRGGDAVVARRGINSVADLKGKSIAVAPLTPSHTFLLWLLDAGDLTTKDVKIVEVPNAIDAATAFKSGKVDAAVVWSPDDEIAVREVKGSKVLESTRNASYIIADVFYAKKAFVEANQQKLNQLYEGWMKGAAEINSSESNKTKASKILSQGLGIPEEDALQAINNVRLCTHGDNENFFALNRNFSGVTGESLYNKMGVIYNKLNYAPDNVPSWRLVANPSLVQASNLSGSKHASESGPTFKPVTEALKTAPAKSTKAVSISFRTGEFKVDENAKYIIDKEFVDLAKAFGNARIRIEGNTDNVGSAASNKALSLKRAQSVATYLETEHGMPKNRFVIVGNGPDNPIADNNTEAGRAKNRRTDFQFLGE